MITYLIQKDNIINNLLIDNETYNNQKGILIRVTNNNQTLKQYYFIPNKKLYLDVLFFGRNKVKSRIKTILKTLGLKVIPDTFKNKDISLSDSLINLNLNKWDIYKGLF
jgi:hypothetical protein